MAGPFPEDERGLAVSTLGMVRRGWDWLGLAPADPPRRRATRPLERDLETVLVDGGRRRLRPGTRAGSR